MNLLLAAEEGFNPFRVSDLSLVLWVLIAFVVILYLLAKRVFPLLEETLADREQRIKGDLEAAERTRADAERILEDYKSRASQLREEANRVGDEIRESARAAAADIKASTELEARKIIEQASLQFEEERNRMLSEAKTQLADLSAGIASRIVAKELDPSTQRELVEQYIREVQNGEAR